MAAEPRRSVFKRAVKDPALVGSGGPPPVTSSASLHAPEAARAKGVRASVFSRNTLTSTGLAALDSALGGGLALGTVACIIEDTPSECHALLLKHFLAQGLVHGHASALCSADDGLLRALPAAIPPSGGGADGEVKAKLASSRATLHAGMASRAGTETPADEHLKIAWRYKESLSNAGRQAAAPLSSVAADYCLRFDLSKAQDATAAAVQREGAANTAPGAVRHVALQQLDPRDHATPNGFAKVWQHVAELIDSTNASEDKVCRLALASVGTPMWWSMAQCSHGRGFVEDGRGSGAARARGLREAVRFMHSLKGKVRGSKCVAVVSIPHDVAAAAVGQRLLRTADYIIRLDALHSCLKPVRDQYADYAAFLHLQKVLRLGALATFTPDSLHFLIKLRKRSLQLDRMHSAVPEDAAGRETQTKTDF